jgi:hypothetical protein
VTSRPEPPENKALKALRAIALPLLVVCSAPVLASSGFSADSDTARANLHDPAAPTATLTVALVDHGMTKADVDLSTMGNSAVDASIATTTKNLTPRAAMIARQIFQNDPGSFESPTLKSAGDLIQISDSDVSSLTSSETTPNAGEQEITNQTKSVTTSDADVSSVEAQLPGLSDVDLLTRFRRQMYRTDI